MFKKRWKTASPTLSKNRSLSLLRPLFAIQQAVRRHYFLRLLILKTCRDGFWIIGNFNESLAVKGVGCKLVYVE